MTSMFPGGDVPEADALIARIRSGELPREMMLLAARGFLPIAQEDLLTVLVGLVDSADEEIRTSAISSLSEVPPRLMLSFASDSARSGEELDALARAATLPPVLESIIRNRSTLDSTVETLARSANPQLQDVIATNQERLLRSPSILEALESNPQLTPDARRRVGEVREEFFEKRRRLEEARALELPPELQDEAELSDEEQAELDALVAQASQAPDETLSTTAPPPGLDTANESVWMALSRLTVAQKVQRAFKGSMTERSILVRERNKLVAGAVARSPRLTDSEVEGFAALRNVEEEVLRIIGMNRTWMGKYPILHNLVRNPKAPIGVVLPLIPRLNIKDLKSLSGDRNVSEAVRSTARRLYNQRKAQ